MKNRRILVLLAALMLLSGCKKQPEPTEPVETTAEATEETTPQVEYATAEADGVPVVLDVLSRGDTVDLAGIFDELHYVVKLEAGYGLVEKNLVRLEGKSPYAAWTGYAYRGAKLYDNYRLAGDPVQALEADAQVEVLEDLGWCCLVDYNGISGYMKPETIAKNPSAGRKAPADSEGQEGQDGGEISLGFGGTVTLLSTLAPQEGTVSGKATVLADDTQVILGYFDRGDRIPLLRQNEKDGYLAVYLDGLYAWVADAYVRTAEEKAFEAWDGRTEGIVSLYDDFWMLGSPSGRLNGNVAVRVLFELENCYLVEAEGMTGYMAKADVAQVPEETTPAATKPTEPAKAPTEPTETTEATESTEATEATEPGGSTEPTVKPTEPTRPAKPVDPTEPADPTEPSKSTEPTAPTETTAPTEAPEWTPPIL